MAGSNPSRAMMSRNRISENQNLRTEIFQHRREIYSRSLTDNPRWSDMSQRSVQATHWEHQSRSPRPTNPDQLTTNALLTRTVGHSSHHKPPLNNIMLPTGQRRTGRKHLDLLFFASTVLAIRMLPYYKKIHYFAKKIHYFLATGTAKDPLTAKAVPLSSHDAAAATVHRTCSTGTS
jgi:hypothetical protein